MHVLVLEGDVVMQELLATLLRSQNRSVHVHFAETVEAGLELWRRESIDLVLCDWNLQGYQNGLNLVKAVRAKDTELPVVMITERADRASVINSMRYRVNEFIVKPFDPEAVADRLSAYLGAGKDMNNVAHPPKLPPLDNWVGDLDGLFERLSIMSDTQQALTLLHGDTRPSARELARVWAKDPAITARLVSLANSSLMRRYGESAGTLLDAVNALGVDMAINQIVAMSLKGAERLEHSYLRQLADQYTDEAGHIAERAATLAQKLKLNVAQSYTAGLMVRLGEQALISAIQQYFHAGGKATEEEVDAAIANHAAYYGNQLKIRWHLPLSLRERVGAAHHLPANSVNPEHILMRVAVCLVHGETEGAEFERLVHRLGLEKNEL